MKNAFGFLAVAAISIAAMYYGHFFLAGSVAILGLLLLEPTS